MIIDTHQHAFWLGHDDEAIVRNMDEHGIDLTWLLTWEGWADEVNEEGYAGSLDPRGDHVWLPLQGVVEACRRYPDRFVAGYCPNPRDPLAPRKLEAVAPVRYLSEPVCGSVRGQRAPGPVEGHGGRPPVHHALFRAGAFRSGLLRRRDDGAAAAHGASGGGLRPGRGRKRCGIGDVTQDSYSFQLIMRLFGS